MVLAILNLNVTPMPPTKFWLNLIELGFNDTLTLVGHFVSSPREKEKREERGTGMKVKQQMK